MNRRITRRRAVKSLAASSLLFTLLPEGLARGYTANEKLNIVIVGCGSRGRNMIEAIPRIGENLVGLCDVNEQRAAAGFQMAPDVPKFHDYRKMIEDHAKGIDAVVVATCDHHHAPCSAFAMKRGKHVYCEKPLTLTVRESREIRRIARETGVATQIGNQGTAADAFREQIEIMQTGGLGEVRETFVWCRLGGAGLADPPTVSESVPKTLQWELWLGPRAARPYNRQWVRWHLWREFATGQLGNWGSHAAAAQFRGLKLDTLWDTPANSATVPWIRVRAECAESSRFCFPRWEIIHFEFPARGDMPPVTMHWFNGDEAPEFPGNIQRMIGGEVGGSGCLVVGTRGKIVASGHNSAYKLIQDEKAERVRKPEPYLPRHGSHEREWLDAIRGKLKRPMSNFDFASREIETLMLGNVATMLGRAIEYDPIAGVCIGDAEATATLDREHREGWKL